MALKSKTPSLYMRHSRAPEQTQPMRWWKIKRWWDIKTGKVCPKCHADLWRVATCGMCGKGGIVTPPGQRAAPPRS